VAELGVFTEEVIQNSATPKNIDEVINDSKAEYEKMKIFNPESKSILLMGLIMKKLKGRVSAKAIADKIGFVKGVK